jgi:hypothetical protein
VQNDNATEPKLHPEARLALVLRRNEVRVGPPGLAMDIEVILTPPCILFRESLTKCTGRYQNDFNVQG